MCVCSQRTRSHLYHLYLLWLLIGNIPENQVFTKNFGILVDALKYTDFYRYFVAEEIITLNDLEEISCESNSIKKVEIFLKKVSSSLEIGFTESFDRMLGVMMKYGNLATKGLARSIKKSIDELKLGIVHIYTYM